MIYESKNYLLKVFGKVLLIIFTLSILISTNSNADVKSKELYFYLDNVTPFNDLNSLIQEIDYLNSSGIKFFVEAWPVFKNEDLNAMGRFAEALRYAQTNGGTIVLKFPILNLGVSNNSLDWNSINEDVQKSFDNYTNYWVYPVAMTIDSSLLYEKEAQELLKSTDTIFLNKEDKQENQDNVKSDSDSYNINFYNNVIQKVDLEDYLKDTNMTLGSKIALSLDSQLDFNEFKKEVDEVSRKSININSTNQITTYMKFDNKVESNLKGIFFNNENVVQERFINEEEYTNSVYKGKNQGIQNKVEDLRGTNRKLEVASGISIIIFIILLLLSRKIERRRFFK